MWALVASTAAAVFCFGWFFGSAMPPSPQGLRGYDPPFASIMALPVLWLMALPFIQVRLANGRWRGSYGDWFRAAWHNKLRLAEAALFTGVFWLLLFLWAQLFGLLGMNFFRELFTRPLFAYPVSAIAFGIALHLIGSLENLVTVALEQLLGLLKWLAVLAALILLLFTLGLLPQLPELFGEGRRTISAAWLLWLIAVMVLMLNAAYRDGSAAQPYPKAIGLALRIVAPLMLVVALTALYALWVRIAALGLTVDRSWGLVVALAGLAYSAGYTWAAIRPGPWMAGMGRINIAVALGLIVTVALMLTPALSPPRLAAASQYRVALETADTTRRRDALRYLRFDAGHYGIRRLEQLAAITDHPRATVLRAAATEAQKLENRWEWQPEVSAEQLLSELPVFPEGRVIDAELRASLLGDATLPRATVGSALLLCGRTASRCAGLFIDLDADGVDEFVVVQPYASDVFAHTPEGWRQQASAGAALGRAIDHDDLITALERGEVRTQAPRWPNLVIGGQVLELHDIPR